MFFMVLICLLFSSACMWLFSINHSDFPNLDSIFFLYLALAIPSLLIIQFNKIVLTKNDVEIIWAWGLIKKKIDRDSLIYEVKTDAIKIGSKERTLIIVYEENVRNYDTIITWFTSNEIKETKYLKNRTSQKGLIISGIIGLVLLLI